MTRMATSPRLATKTLENMRRGRLFHRALRRSAPEVGVRTARPGKACGHTASGSALVPRGASGLRDTTWARAAGAGQSAPAAHSSSSADLLQERHDRLDEVVLGRLREDRV